MLIAEAYIPTFFIIAPTVMLLSYTNLSGSSAAAIVSTCLTAVSISILLTSESGHFINIMHQQMEKKYHIHHFSFIRILSIYCFVSAICALAYLWLAPPLYGFSLTNSVALGLIILLSTGIPISYINIARSEFNKVLTRRWKNIIFAYMYLIASNYIIFVADKVNLINAYAIVIWSVLGLVIGLLRGKESNSG